MIWEKVKKHSKNMLTLSIMTFSIIGTPDLKQILLRSQDLWEEIIQPHIKRLALMFVGVPYNPSGGCTHFP